MTLIQLHPGARGIITSVKGNDMVRQRLFDMGLMPNQSIQLARIAPLGFPVWIKSEDSQICLRKSEAAMLEVTLTDSNEAV